MTFSYLASFDVSDPGNGFSYIQVAASGKTSFQVQVPSFSNGTWEGGNTCRVFNHYSGLGLGRTASEDRRVPLQLSQSYGGDSFGFLTQNIIRAGATTAGWGTTAVNALTCAFTSSSTPVLRYTFGYNSAFAIAFGSAATASLYGFSSLTASGSASLVGDILPDFIIKPSLPAVSDPTTNYEPDSITSQAVSGSGIAFGLSRSAAPLYRDWVQQYELRENTLRLAALTTAPFTHQELFESGRGMYPFVVQNGFGTGNDEVFILRAEGSNFKPDRAAPGWDVFHITYKTIVQGTILFG